jgi:hypothetical protein
VTSAAARQNDAWRRAVVEAQWSGTDLIARC